MCKIRKAASVEEAVELASRFRDLGHYNWFRGQVQDWPPFSSFFRVAHGGNKELEIRSLERINMFFDWIAQIQELKKELAEGSHAAFAVAQHYGIPTHYIDFTTEPGVAGFFAADTAAAPKTGQMGCIYCLNTDELLELWNSVNFMRKKAHLELVTIDVSNLWRLEAQHGCFLFCDYNWDIDFPMDRILFPYTGYPSWPTKEDIYPPQKSSLELLLDQYFDVEQKIFGSRSLREYFRELQSKSPDKFFSQPFEAPPEGYHAEAVKKDLPALNSWHSAALSEWTHIQVERFDDAIGAPITLQVKMGATPSQAAGSISYGIQQLLNTRKGARGRLFSWILSGLTTHEPLRAEVLSRKLQMVWNGMRSLPYTDKDIATACGVTTRLFLENFMIDSSVSNAARVLGDCFLVEFATADGSSSRGYVKRESLRLAIREDIAEYASDKILAALEEDIRHILLGIFAPNRLLEFNQMQAIFANELIPTQVLTRDLVLYSPARLSIFGLP